MARTVRNMLAVWRPGFNPWAGKIPWRRAWQPTPLSLPGESQEQRSLAGYSPWGHKELDPTKPPGKWHYLLVCAPPSPIFLSKWRLFSPSGSPTPSLLIPHLCYTFRNPTRSPRHTSSGPSSRTPLLQEDAFFGFHFPPFSRLIVLFNNKCSMHHCTMICTSLARKDFLPYDYL